MLCTMCDGTGRYMTVDPYGEHVEYMVDCTFCDEDGQMIEESDADNEIDMLDHYAKMRAK